MLKRNIKNSFRKDFNFELAREEVIGALEYLQDKYFDSCHDFQVAIGWIFLFCRVLLCS